MNKEIIDYTKTLVLTAGNMLRTAPVGQVYCLYKEEDQRDLLTEYDMRIQDFLISHLRKEYPDYKFISEEKNNNQDISGLVWIIDPIDGTTNFVCFKKDFAISVALYQDGNPLFGIVYDVMNDDIYLGITGQGAYLNDQKLGRVKESHLKECILDASLNSVQIFYNLYSRLVFNMAQDIRGHRSLGAASLAICKIARGEIQIYLSAKLKAWDFAAAGIVLHEVGGYYDAVSKESLNLIGKPVAFLACSSKSLFNEILIKYFEE
ncbi:MAG: inositol monophosphatase family protein [Bacillota bacterium]